MQDKQASFILQIVGFGLDNLLFTGDRELLDVFQGAVYRSCTRAGFVKFFSGLVYLLPRLLQHFAEFIKLGLYFTEEHPDFA